MIQRDYLIIGAGIGGAEVCRTLREYDPKGSVAIVGNESILPYHRSRLLCSLMGAKSTFSSVTEPPAPLLGKILHLAPEWYAKNKIELRLDTLVTQLNLDKRLAVLNTGQVIEFRKACLATGSRPQRLQLAGINLGNVLTLRTVRDVMALREIANVEKPIVIIGSGFTAAEAAASLSAVGYKVRIMSRHPYLWQEMLDSETARWLTDYFVSQGVEVLNEALNGFEGKTVLSNIQAKSGNRIPAGVAVIAAGVDLNLGLVANTPLASPNGTPVNECLETDEKGIYAIGDIALYPDSIFGGVRRTAYWETTLEQALIVGGNITGKKRQKFKALAHHALTVFDLRFEFIGDFSQTPVRFEIEGERSKRRFSARYFQGNKLMGVLLCNQPVEVSAAAKQEVLSAHGQK